MKSDSTISRFHQPDTIDDPLTSVLRDGARRLLAHAIEAEADNFLAMMHEERLDDGRARFVRHGHGPERVIQTGIGPVPVKRAKVRDRVGEDESSATVEPVRFTSAILPKWVRIPTRCRLPFRFDVGHHSDVKPATVPINHRPLRAAS